MAAPKIQQIGEDIKMVLRKERVGTISEDKIGQAIVAAEKDLYNELVAIYKTQKYFHEQLRPFVVKDTLTMTAGLNSIGSDIQALLSAEVVDGSNRWPARIVYDPEKFGSGDIVDSENEGTSLGVNESRLLKEMDITLAVTALPDNFIEAVGGYNLVGTEAFRAVEVSPKRWGSKDSKDIMGEGESPDEINHLNIEELTVASGSIVSGEISPITGMSKLLSASVIVNNKEYEGVVVAPENFGSRKLKDLFINGGLKKHLSIVKSTISLTDGVGDLPDGFIMDKAVFDADGFEGIILDHAEFLDRANSVILTPDEEEPIGHVTDDQITVSPDTIQSIDIYHYQFPTDKTPVVAVFEDAIRIYPTTPAGDFKLRYIADATQKRPRFKIDGGNITVNPVPDSTFKLTYKAYPNEKAAQVRYVSGDIEVKPATVSSLYVTYLDSLTSAIYATKNATNNRGKEFDDASSTDTTFGENATQALLAKALKYLGVPYQDQGAASFENIQRGN